MGGIFRSASLERDIERYLNYETEAEARYPVCCRCGERVFQDTVLRTWDGEVICDECSDGPDEELGFREPIE